MEILRISSAHIKIHQILVIFETTNQTSNFASLFKVMPHNMFCGTVILTLFLISLTFDFLTKAFVLIYKKSADLKQSVEVLVKCRENL